LDNSFEVLVTDLDHTLLHPETGQITDRTPELLQEWMNQGHSWIIATGRELAHLQEVLSEVGLHPHYSITRSRYIHATRSEPHPELTSWNRSVRRLTKKQWDYAQEWIPKAKRWASDNEIEVDTDEGYVTFEDADAAEKAFHYISKVIDEDFKVLRNREFLVVVPRETGKGNCLKRLSELNQWDESEIFCVGDGMNDANMLDGDFEYGKAAVANAEQPLKELVTREGGWVLDEVGGPAVEGLLRTFLNGKLGSAGNTDTPDSQQSAAP
jgi:HAD superfamily hydrolase (TIGR01484 family)